MAFLLATKSDTLQRLLSHNVQVIASILALIIFLPHDASVEHGNATVSRLVATLRTSNLAGIFTGSIRTKAL